MSHQETYTHNEAYAEFLANWDANFYAKYADTLKPAPAGALGGAHVWQRCRRTHR